MDSQTPSSQVADTVASLKGIPTREDLLTMLKENVLEITFTKLNGDERTMPCTLMEQHLPPAKKEDPLTQKKVREVSDAVVPVWVPDAKGFRSFRYDRVKKVTVIDNFSLDNEG